MVNFPFVPNGKFKVFSLNTLNFSFGTNGKFMVLDVPILKHSRVVVFFLEWFLSLWEVFMNSRATYSEAFDENFGIMFRFSMKTYTDFENWRHFATAIHTLKCLSIGTPKAINFPFVSNEKLMFFRCPSIQAHCNEAVIYLNFGAPKIMNFPWKIYYF